MLPDYEIVRSWKDPDVRDGTAAPDHPAGEITLPGPEPVGGFFMNALIAAAVMPASSEPLYTIGCCYCDCTCGVQQGCNRNDCPP
jgi:mersacidin/lichenicidin family type 2 lantibiotic